MTTDQILITGILVLAFAGFLWDRLRHDAVAFLALVLATALGLVPAGEMFAGFGHPATITVAMVLIIGRGLQNAGAVDLVAKHLLPPLRRPEAHIGVLASVGGALSAVMNNVGALALLMPAALASARRAKRAAAQVLMPLSFGSILGGLVTLIGTPPNIIVATFRADFADGPFRMFDFTPVGAAVAVAGVLFVALAGWRLIPEARRTAPSTAEAIAIETYVSEARVGRGSKSAGKKVSELEDGAEELDASILEVLRHGRRLANGGRRAELRVGDVLLVEVGPENLEGLLKTLDLKHPARRRGKKDGLFTADDVAVIEAVVAPRSPLAGRTVGRVDLRRRHGINLLAVSREGKPIRSQLKKLSLRPGDVLLLEGDAERLADAATAMKCLPLAERGLNVGRLHLAGIAIGLFGAAVAAAAVGIIALPLALAIAAGGLILLNLVPPREIYESVDWPVVVLIGAMIPIGTALQATGTTGLAADALFALARGAPPAVLLVVLMALTMTLSDVINNAATAVVMAPVAAGLAATLGVAPDAFLMGVAISASCAFLTPIGHQNNTLIMGPGGYRFGDYWRMGLPLEVLVIAVSVPMLLLVWPL